MMSVTADLGWERTGTKRVAGHRKAYGDRQGVKCGVSDRAWVFDWRSIEWTTPSGGQPCVTVAALRTANKNWLAVTKKERAALTSYRVQ